MAISRSAKEMNIAVFQNLPPGGGKRVVYEQVKGLIKRGHHIDVYQLSSPHPDFCDLKSLACRVSDFKFSKHPNRLLADWQNFIPLRFLHKQIANIINHGNYDTALIHTDMYTESPFILRYLTIPNIYFCHELLRIGYEPELAFHESVGFAKTTYENITRKIRVALDKNNARSADKIITTSKFIQKKILSAYGKKAEVCYLGADLETFKPHGPKQNLVIFMGSKSHVGGYDFVREIQKKRNFKLIAYGFSQKGPDLNDDTALAKAYSGSLACLCVSINEPFGLKALESMACATPVLAVNEGGYRETVVDGVTGWLLPRDPRAFADKIKFLQSHPEIVAKMGKAGRKHVIDNFTWDRHVNRLLSLIHPG